MQFPISLHNLSFPNLCEIYQNGQDLDAENYKALMRETVVESVIIPNDPYLLIFKPWY